MNPTELEGAVLGVIWADGPLTTYAIRSRFLKSRSSHFSGSAGAIYPLVDRLQDMGLVQSTPSQRGSRPSHRLTITPEGKKALQEWLAQDKGGMAAVEFDPIRTRVHFLGALGPRQRQRFLQESMTALQLEIEETRSLIDSLRETGDRWSVLGATGAMRTLQARLSWLREILETS